MIPELAALAVGSFVIALSGALMPGPLLTITIGESARRGARAGPLLMVGHGILEGVLVVVILSGLSAFLTDDRFKLVSFLLGGTVLFIMGCSMIRQSSSIRFDAIMQGESKGGNLILLGIAGSLSNPYWIIWWATIGLGYLFAAIKTGIPGVISFFAGHIAADFAWYCLVSAAVARGRSIFSNTRYRRLILGCGIFLLFFGAWFLLEGIKAGVQ